ncbi:MAG: helix-turn-helix domain-containing protein [Janthinobacterium lividum]
MKNPAGIAAFGLHLRQLREGRGLSQQALADSADLAKLTIQRIEHAKGAPTLDVLISLAHALELPLRELVDFVAPPTPLSGL